MGNIFAKQDKSDRKYSAGGKLLENRGQKYGYDEEGNWAYEWSGNGMLKTVTRPDGKKVSFEYDALGRRTAKIFDGKITRWVWDGSIPLHEWRYSVNDRPKTIVDEFGMLAKDREEPVENLITWIFDEGTFKPTAKIVDGSSYSVITDYLGTPCEAYDSDGEKVWSMELETYGKVKSCQGGQGFVPFRFQGQYEDMETGLYYNRFRYYSPEEGMYVSQDPIRLAGGLRPNSFVHDPNIYSDPLGLAKKKKDCVPKKVYRFINEEDAARLKDGLGIKSKGTGGSITDQVKGKPTKFISASEGNPTARFDSGTGLVAIDVDKAVQGGSGFVDETNVLQALKREGASALDIENAKTAREVLFKNEIPFDAIEIISLP